jgi:hypothetical protein
VHCRRRSGASDASDKQYADYKEKPQPWTRAMREEQGSYWDNSSN